MTEEQQPQQPDTEPDEERTAPVRTEPVEEPENGSSESTAADGDAAPDVVVNGDDADVTVDKREPDDDDTSS